MWSAALLRLVRLKKIYAKTYYIPIAVVAQANAWKLWMKKKIEGRE